VIEEAPAINMPAALRARMADAAIAAARAVEYLGAGTVEFLVPGGPLAADTPFYFMEMNTRLQIEHPVTELITGLDLVEWQFRVAAGEPLPLSQDRIESRGAAVEARLYAEDPATGFLPSPGIIRRAAFPQRADVRVDSGVAAGSDVPPHYDAMIAKIIGFGDTRGAAYDALLAGLADTVLAGPRTNLAFLHRLAAHASTDGESLSTRYIENHLAELTQSPPDAAAIGAGALALLAARQSEAVRMRRAVSDEPHSPWDIADAFELTGSRESVYDFEADGATHKISIMWDANGPKISDSNDDGGMAQAQIIPADESVIVWRAMRQTHMRFQDRRRAGPGDASGGVLRSPMPGRLAKLFVREGDHVTRGDRIAVIEAMKMEHILHAPADGSVKSLPRGEGEQVDLGAVIAELRTDDGHASD
jgi:3-methylcrotonyl-CoA carboxylase alpha subunit